MLNNLEQKIIKKIKQEKHKPLSYTLFIIRKIMFWFLIVTLLLLAALSLSVMVLIIIYGDWDIYKYLGYSSSTTYFIKAFPYFWLFALFIFFGISLKKVKKADGVYKYSFATQGIIALFIVLLIALVFFIFEINQKTETLLSSNRLYIKTNYFRSSWENPEKGLLSGVLKIENNNYILEDSLNKKWNLIFITESIRGINLLVDNNRIKIIGEINKDNQSEFVVNEIRPWECTCPHCASYETFCPNCSNNNFCSSDSSCMNH